ncbi:MAG: hypothetical protein MUC68_08325 [Burkholderiaceae bacterium]|jgi:hypothetical protein|nr:hypothetical protein [Burkholderiaceae bacterium]
MGLIARHLLRGAAIVLVVAALLATALAFALGMPGRLSGTHQALSALVSPGALSQSHAGIATTCADCHQPLSAVGSATCGTCHHHEPALLARLPTAFHADATTCGACHTEHRGGARMPTKMDHAALLTLASDLRLPADAGQGGAMLDCAACHQRQDRHQGRFGTRCEQCHGISAWTVADFRHPSPRSIACVECHREPPSHTMEHFTMVSQTVARQPTARVDQCYLCHRTTSWNDIPGVGWHKHH